MRYSKRMITTTLVDTWTVTPSSPTTSVQRETLSEVDEWQTRSSHWLGFSLRFEGALDTQALKQGLERTLEHIPALGARVDSQEKLYQLVLDPQNQGVTLECFRGRTSRKDIHLPDDTDARHVWKEAGLEAPAPGFSGEASLKDPLLRARLIVFEEHNVSYLCIGINHGLCDGYGMCDILQTWSHFSTGQDASTLPDHLARRRVMGERVTKAHKPAASVADLTSRLQEDTGFPYNPLSLWTFLWRILPAAIWCMSRQVELELRVNAKKLAALKKSVTQQLPEGEWVSTFEVLCASVLLARQVTSPKSSFATKQPHTLHVACDLRGRSKRFSKDYFGNAAFDFRQTITLPDDETCNLPFLAQEIHRGIRTGLANPEEVCRSKDWFEAARHLGLKNTFDVWPMVFDALKGTGTFVNSWERRFLQCDMNGVPASSMMTWFGTLQNLMVNVPRHAPSGDSTIYLALPPAHAKRFKAYCQVHAADLPFEILHCTK